MLREGIRLTYYHDEHHQSEISEIDVVFGKNIFIIENNSYKPFHGNRVEGTSYRIVEKKDHLDPTILCNDVCEYMEGKEKTFESLVDAINLLNI